MEAVLAGFGLGLSLILAIGGQNAFVLRQGVRREHVFAVVLTCALSDAILITAGVAGFGALAKAMPGLEVGMRYGGAAFLIWYGALALISAWRDGKVMAAANGTGSLRMALLTCLALTWLNPHVYLDTVVLLGSISAQYDDRLGFALGAIAASFIFFFSLGFGARALTSLFAKPAAWRWLDAGVGCVMWVIAVKLLMD
ncbi:LysE/ArgO family amino acid transporter [Roseovarius aestuariivivens]|uniref:LysE/ArgO family amino acid transporter n=1 Tax=Roseovarius aestuariivivens TaxID=1888910 RepID=UPI0010805E3A|nr:LysE/ArgO family amino acid transporter [Roseovarius aestuariivivens]